MTNAIRRPRIETAETLGRNRLHNAAYLARTLAELTDDQLQEMLDELRPTFDALEEGPVRQAFFDFAAITRLDLDGRIVDLNHMRAQMADGHLLGNCWDSHPDWGNCWFGVCFCDWEGPQRPSEEQAEEDALQHLRDVGAPDMRNGAAA